jgi:hypothetical protein
MFSRGSGDCVCDSTVFGIRVVASLEFRRLVVRVSRVIRVIRAIGFNSRGLL